MADVAASGGAKKNSPIGTFFWILAVVCLAFWIALLLDEIQTSEAWLGAPLGASLVPNWLVLWQPIALFTGTLPANMIGPVIGGWVAELLVLGGTFAMEVSMVHAKRYNGKIANALGTICGAALIYDGWTNYASGFAHGDWLHQAVFIVGLAAGVVILPILALAFFKLSQVE